MRIVTASFLTLLAATAAAVPAFVACGGDDTIPAMTTDAGDAGDASTADASSQDATTDADAGETADADAGVDSPWTPHPWDASCVAPTYDAGATDAATDGGVALGRLLLAGNELCVNGFTPAGDVIYTDLRGDLGVVPWSGGCAEAISTKFDGAGYVNETIIFSNAAVFYWTTEATSPLYVWTREGGATRLSENSPPAVNSPITPAWWAANTDGSWVAFREPQGIILERSDGSTRTSLVSTGNCPMTLQFSPAGDLYASYCAASSTTATISKFAAGTWAKTDLATGLVPQENGPSFFGPNVVTDPTGKWTWAEVAPAPGNSKLINTSTGVSTTLDQGGGAGLFDPIGSQLFYDTSAGLKRTTTANPSAVTLTSSADVQYPVALSPDGQHLLARNAAGAFATVSATTPSTPTTITTVFSFAASYPLNDWFTADSKYVLSYSTSVSSVLPDATLSAVPVDGSGPGMSLPGKQGSYAVGGSFVAVADIANPNVSSGDVSIIDVSGVAPSRLIAPGAWVISGPTCGWMATPDRKNLVYSRSGEGLYVVSTQ